MSEQKPDSPALTPESELVLRDWDMYARVATRATPYAHVYDCDGFQHATVTRSIHPSDLNELLAYGQRMRQRGHALGEEHIRASFRAFIGAMPAKPQT